MSHLTPTFHSRAEQIHREHERIEETLADFEVHLMRMSLPGHPEADGRVCRLARELARLMPPHCKREEQELHDVVAGVSPQLEEFTAVMKQQHRALMARLDGYIAVVNEFETQQPPALRERVQSEGRALVREIRSHVAAEEKELSGFL